MCLCDKRTIAGYTCNDYMFFDLKILKNKIKS
uniref:Uncharacterized protein n=1 Tax=Anguilla anguilla TaxID=7936 RepID=A0A0E9RN76_ANGAN